MNNGILRAEEVEARSHDQTIAFAPTMGKEQRMMHGNGAGK